ncbi:MAG: Rrf2 family transcriptional regulator [Geminicoccaceae bacterium]|nr:Rrf2 family transcriptional regulator [Geminicoccaceae bacterium]MCB9944878.1 Rrf2 family transcriptional regulator [Geminicoccaceae bacterium]
MLRPSKKLALALEAVVDIACQATLEPVQSLDIGQRMDLPRRYLEQVMQQLVRAGILKGVRGPRGGYRLARERRRITIADVVAVVERVEDDDNSVPTSQSELGQRVMTPFWAGIEREFVAKLSTITIEDLCRRAESLDVNGDKPRGMDFSI